MAKGTEDQAYDDWRDSLTEAEDAERVRMHAEADERIRRRCSPTPFEREIDAARLAR